MLKPESWDTPRVDKVEFYRDASGEWRWRYINSDNGKAMADSGEGYHNLTDAETAARRLFDPQRVVFALIFGTEEKE